MPRIQEDTNSDWSHRNALRFPLPNKKHHRSPVGGPDRSPILPPASDRSPAPQEEPAIPRSVSIYSDAANRCDRSPLANRSGKRPSSSRTNSCIRRESPAVESQGIRRSPPPAHYHWQEPVPAFARALSISRASIK